MIIHKSRSQRYFILATLLALTILQATNAAAAALSPAADIDFDALDTFIEAQMQKHGLPGVSLAVVEGDEILYLRGYGTAGALPMTPQTQTFIGSQSKSFTALTIAQLAEQGKIDLNAPVQTYIPWFKVADADASARITVNHFLHHTSGLSESGHSVVLPANATSEEAVRSLASAQPTAPIGAKFQYFNLGYDVLTYLIESVTGERYAEYIKANVFDPLEMTSSTAYPSTITHLSRGYTRLFGFAMPVRQTVRDYEIGAGYIVSTAEDMARYSIAMLQNMEYGGTSLLSPESAGKFFIPGLANYAMGWWVVDNGSRIFHGGANETFHTEVLLYPKRERAFVLLINQGYLVDHYISTVQLTAGVEDIVLGRTPAPVETGPSVRWIGWGVGMLVLALLVLHAINFYKLFNGWKERFQNLFPFKKVLDVAISFIIPTVILFVVFSQMKAFFDYRFNLLTSLVNLRYVLPDIFILMIVGTLPDYVQGFIKIFWIMSGKTGKIDLQNEGSFPEELNVSRMEIPPA